MQQDRRVVCAECAEGCVVWRDGDAAVDGQTPALRVIAQEIEEQLDGTTVGVDGIGGLERCPLEIRVARGSERTFYKLWKHRDNLVDCRLVWGESCEVNNLKTMNKIRLFVKGAECQRQERLLIMSGKRASYPYRFR